MLPLVSFLLQLSIHVHRVCTAFCTKYIINYSLFLILENLHLFGEGDCII